MTPRQKTNLEVIALVIAAFMALGGAFAYGSSLVSEVNVQKTRLDSVESRLERIEKKIDKLIERRS
jgi:hypothetical protein